MFFQCFSSTSCFMDSIYTSKICFIIVCLFVCLFVFCSIVWQIWVVWLLIWKNSDRYQLWIDEKKLVSFSVVFVLAFLQTGISKLIEVVIVPQIKPTIEVFSSLSHDITEVCSVIKTVYISPVIQYMLVITEREVPLCHFRIGSKYFYCYNNYYVLGGTISM